MRAYRSSTPAIAFALAVGLIACGDDAGGGKADSGQTPDAAVPADAGATDGKVQTGDSGGTDSGGAKSDGATPDSATPTDAASSAPPSLTTATAKQVGRFGTDLLIEVAGSDADKNLDLVGVVLLDKDGAQLGNERRLPIDPPITKVDGTAKLMLSGALEGQTVLGTAKITLIDRLGAGSNTIDAAIGAQTVAAAGASCDATFVLNRCGEGLGCKGAGTATTCSPGEAPKITKVGYFDDELGRRIVIEGTDADADVAKYTVRFLAEDGTTAVPYDLDADPSTMSVSSLTVVNGESAGQTSFFFRVTPDQEFVKLVKRVGITVSDARASTAVPTNTSTELVSEVIKAATARASGAACTLHGFDVCKGAMPLVCSPQGNDGVCKTVSSARTAACNTAPSLIPGSNMLSVRGKLSGASLWDSLDCSPDVKNQPDAVVKFNLATDAAKVTLTTDFAYTSFNSELTLFRSPGGGCGDIPPNQPVSWCATDAYTDGLISGPQPTMVVENLAAGSYFVLVDSFPSFESTGELFQLDVKVE